MDRTGNITVHVINGTPEEIKARLLESVDAFFEIYTDTLSNAIHSEARNRRKVILRPLERP